MDITSPDPRLHPTLPELTRVSFTRDIADWDGKLFPAGTRGTIVTVYEPGVAYAVEAYAGGPHLFDVMAEDIVVVDEQR